MSRRRKLATKVGRKKTHMRRTVWKKKRTAKQRSGRRAEHLNASLIMVRKTYCHRMRSARYRIFDSKRGKTAK